MSITNTTDVFCDICSNWIFGVTGPRSNARGARHRAKENGWTRRMWKGKMVDVCPHCKAELERDSLAPDEVLLPPGRSIFPQIKKE